MFQRGGYIVPRWNSIGGSSAQMHSNPYLLVAMLDRKVDLLVLLSCIGFQFFVYLKIAYVQYISNIKNLLQYLYFLIVSDVECYLYMLRNAKLIIFQGEANGELYIDDFHSFNYKLSFFIHRQFIFANNELRNM